MSLLSNSLLAVILVGLTGSTGCALTGRTRPQSVVAPASLQAQLDIKAVGLERGQTKVNNVGTFAWGEYDAHDVEVLHEMLRQTAATASVSPEAPALDVHVIVRRFLVAHSNNEGFVVACVAWALTDAEGELVFHEQFYASDYVRTWGTIGGLKNHVHQGITQHVLHQANRVAAGQEPAAPSSQYVHATYEAATAGMPSSLTSIHFNTVMLGGGYSFVARKIEGESERGWARRDDHVDWDSVLASNAVP